MLCNNIGIKVSNLVNYRICVMHSVANRTFFLYYSMRKTFSYTMRFGIVAGINFMLVSVYNILSRYKADQ